ncbi:MAG: type II toxin-antitoxin system VapC family toxin [Acidobacteria bacterium]|nr:type II toxin-antitoxin system VapC family toxin [Acidobacteriota bacterium]
MGGLPVKYLLDTHAWIWWHMQPRTLSLKVCKLIENKDGYEEILLSAISPWEFSKLLERGRLGISCHPEDWIRAALEMPKLRLVPITPAIAYRSTVLPTPFHRDPADQLIVATAREEDAVILTRDERILDYAHARSLW